MHYLTFYIILIVFFLGLSLFFSGSETAFMAVNRLRLKYLAESGDRKAEYIKHIVSNPDRLLGVILLGNTIANVAAATLVTYVVAFYAPAGRTERYSIYGSAALTLVILIFCELTPKIIAATNSEKVSRKLILPIRISMWLLSPFARLASFLASRLVRIAGVSTGASPFTHALSEEEIRSIIAGSDELVMAEARKQMLDNIFEIGDTQVREVMIPRTEVTAVEIDDPIPKILSVFSKTNYSRIPVFRDSFDNIMGILYVKDLVQHMQRPGAINLKALLRPIHFVPDTARLEPVLRQLQSMHLHMAIVVDEFGGVEGIITLEDLIEEIVGEIRDEHDTEPESVRELGPKLFSVAGNLPVRDFNRIFESKIPESREYTTVVGFLLARTGRLLQAGENIRYKDLNFFIEKVAGFKILSIRVRVPKARQGGTPAQLSKPA